MNLLTCLKSFVTVANCQSFSVAARRLYVSASKLSKEINWLEEKYKAQLFIRSTRQLSLTKNGKLLYSKAVKVLNEVDQLQLTGEADSEELHGFLRVYLTVTPAIPYLVSKSLEFMKLHPKLEIAILVASEAVPLGDSFFDVGITFDSIKHPNFESELFFEIQRAIYASPKYLENHKVENLDQLVDHNCLINTSYGLQNKWIFDEKVIQVSGTFQSNNAGVLKQAAVEGAGLIWTPPFSVQEEVNEGKLVPVLPGVVSPYIPLYYKYPKHISDTKNLQALINFYREHAIDDGYAIYR